MNSPITYNSQILIRSPINKKNNIIPELKSDYKDQEIVDMTLIRNSIIYLLNSVNQLNLSQLKELKLIIDNKISNLENK
jgi:hypothetical protein